jgi:hypothetical protein
VCADDCAFYLAPHGWPKEKLLRSVERRLNCVPSVTLKLRRTASAKGASLACVIVRSQGDSHISSLPNQLLITEIPQLANATDRTPLWGAKCPLPGSHIDETGVADGEIIHLTVTSATGIDRSDPHPVTHMATSVAFNCHIPLRACAADLYPFSGHFYPDLPADAPHQFGCGGLDVSANDAPDKHR